RPGHVGGVGHVARLVDETAGQVDLEVRVGVALVDIPAHGTVVLPAQLELVGRVVDRNATARLLAANLRRVALAVALAPDARTLVLKVAAAVARAHACGVAVAPGGRRDSGATTTLHARAVAIAIAVAVAITSGVWLRPRASIALALGSGIDTDPLDADETSNAQAPRDAGTLLDARVGAHSVGGGGRLPFVRR